jgi:hypothetical protein
MPFQIGSRPFLLAPRSIFSITRNVEGMRSVVDPEMMVGKTMVYTGANGEFELTEGKRKDLCGVGGGLGRENQPRLLRSTSIEVKWGHPFGIDERSRTTSLSFSTLKKGMHHWQKLQPLCRSNYAPRQHPLGSLTRLTDSTVKSPSVSFF